MRASISRRRAAASRCRASASAARASASAAAPRRASRRRAARCRIAATSVPRGASAPPPAISRAAWAGGTPGRPRRRAPRDRSSPARRATRPRTGGRSGPATGVQGVRAGSFPQSGHPARARNWKPGSSGRARVWARAVLEQSADGRSRRPPWAGWAGQWISISAARRNSGRAIPPRTRNARAGRRASPGRPAAEWERASGHVHPAGDQGEPVGLAGEGRRAGPRGLRLEPGEGPCRGHARDLDQEPAPGRLDDRASAEGGQPAGQAVQAGGRHAGSGIASIGGSSWAGARHPTPAARRGFRTRNPEPGRRRARPSRTLPGGGGSSPSTRRPRPSSRGGSPTPASGAAGPARPRPGRPGPPTAGTTAPPGRTRPAFPPPGPRPPAPAPAGSGPSSRPPPGLPTGRAPGTPDTRPPTRPTPVRRRRTPPGRRTG